MYRFHHVFISILLVVVLCFGETPQFGSAANSAPIGLTAQLVKDINQGTEAPSSSTPGPFISINNRVYFGADNNLHDRELWFSDGNDNSTSIVRNINSGEFLFYPSAFRNISDTLFLSGVITTQANLNAAMIDPKCLHRQLLRTSGTPSQTVQLTNLPNGVGLSYRLNGTCQYEEATYVSVGNRFFFTSINELWVTDGSPSGVQLVKKLPGWIMPNSLYEVNGSLYLSTGGFEKPVAGFRGLELWRSDGTEVGTQLVKAFQSMELGAGLSLNGKFMFFANGPMFSTDLWISDGTVTGTTSLKSVGYAQQPHIVLHDGQAFFARSDIGDTTTLLKSDGTISGTVKVVEIIGSGYTLTSIKSVNGHLFVSVGYGTKPSQLLHLNQSNNTLEPFTPNTPPSFYLTYYLPANWQGSTVFFINDQLWTTDGSITGTRKLLSLPLDLSDTFFNKDSLEENIVGWNLFFPGQDSVHGTELWRLTANELTDIYVTSNSFIGAQANDKVTLPLHYGNLGPTAASSVTLTATLPVSLSYVGNSLNLSPTIDGAEMVWQLPGVEFLGEKQFDLILQTPDAVLGTRYPVTITVTSRDPGGDTSDNTSLTSVMIAKQTYLPVVMR